VFTTHTPVPAGIDRFPRHLMERYFAGWAHECGIDVHRLMRLGHFPGDEAGASFNMAVMGLRLAGRSNAVSKLHGRVSRSMFSPLWPDVPEDEVPIRSVTNGVHGATWVSAEMSELLERRVLAEWGEAGAEHWARVAQVADDELWRVREQGRANLVAFVRRHLRASLTARGVSESDLAWTEEALDPRALTVCFARRFATYKRGTLLLSQPDRLRALLLSTDRPVQFVFAGKAHPADDAGKEMIRQIVSFSSDPSIRHRLVFVDDYDMAVARFLYSGADVWLNNPRRPLEACGTSGMKAALNGALNCSILDGWWDECFDGENGWAITSAESLEPPKRDQVEADSLFSLLEQSIVPLFYERMGGPVPRRWVGRVKASLASLGHQVSATRMVGDYVADLYEPTGALADQLAADGYGRATALASWKERVAAAWDGVQVEGVEADAAAADLGGARSVSALVALGALGESDVEVQLLHGPVGQNDELDEPAIVAMVPEGDGHGGPRRYTGSVPLERAGRYGFTVRVVPRSADLVTPVELGLVAWA
jgi:starch phosphorylase